MKNNEKTESRIALTSFPGYFLLGCLLVGAVLLYKVLEPFIVPLILAAVLATAFFPLYNRVKSLLKGKDRLASVMTCFIILIGIVVPLTLFILLLGKESFDIYKYVQIKFQSGYLESLFRWEKGNTFFDAFSWINAQLNGAINLDNVDFSSQIGDYAKVVTSFIAEQSANIVKGFGGLLIGAFVLFFALYYFFKDNDKILNKLTSVSPLPGKHDDELIRKFKEISLASLYGIFLTAIAQGICGGIGFAISGVPNVLFWGTAISVFSLVPVIGTASIWLPASIILLLSGNYFGGIFLFFWGMLVVSTVDNFLRAYLIGEKTKSNQLMIFLAVFGGIKLFGLVGVIFGPLILNLFFTFVNIYETEYSSILDHTKKG